MSTDQQSQGSRAKVAVDGTKGSGKSNPRSRRAASAVVLTGALLLSAWGAWACGSGAEREPQGQPQSYIVEQQYGAGTRCVRTYWRGPFKSERAARSWVAAQDKGSALAPTEYKVLPVHAAKD